MIDNRTYREIRYLRLQLNVPLREIARMLCLSRKTVRKWAKIEKYTKPKALRKTQEDSKRNKRPSETRTARCRAKADITSWLLLVVLGKFSPAQLIETTHPGLEIDEAETILNGVVHGTLRQRIRGLTILLHLMKIPVREISRQLTSNKRTVSTTIEKFRDLGPEYVFKPKDTKPCKHELPEYKDAVFSILHSPPSEYGINRTTWIMPDLQRVMSEKGLAINVASLRKIITEAGYRFRKAKKVLTSTDPNYRVKLESITAILSRLTDAEAFFSIDEFGPLSVKITGGTSLTAPGERRVVPQIQKSRGRVLLVGALNLSTNQITHFYADRKNTAEMIKLLHLLLEQYKSKERLYFSWDAASWHGSKLFEKEVKRINEDEFRTKNGTPEVILAPLPACSQFLNVIESVFSGMARAVIHNSDYESAEQCMSCIDRHFIERNKYFIENPKRAGDKIWGKERVVPVFKSSNNCKDPLYR